MHVARLAGIPEPVIRRADALLRAAERARGPSAELPLFASAGTDPAPHAAPAATLEEAGADWRAALADTDPDRLSPREALDRIYAWRRKFLGDRPAGAVEKE